MLKSKAIINMIEGFIQAIYDCFSIFFHFFRHSVSGIEANSTWSILHIGRDGGANAVAPKFRPTVCSRDPAFLTNTIFCLEPHTQKARRLPSGGAGSRATWVTRMKRSGAWQM